MIKLRPFARSLTLAWMALQWLGSCGGSTQFIPSLGENNSADALPAPEAVAEQQRQVEAIIVTPRAAMVPVGSMTLYQAFAVYDDGSEEEVTAAAVWRAEPSSIAKAGKDGGKAKVFAESPGEARVIARFGDDEGIGQLTVVEVMEQAPKITAIKIVPGEVTLNVGNTVAFKAVATLSNGTEIDVTHLAVWSSADAGVAAFDGDAGAATALGVGETAVTAVYGDHSAEAKVTVTEAVIMSLMVTPATATLYNGEILAYSATGMYSDNVQRDVTALADWTADAPAIGAFLAAGQGNQFLASGAGSTMVKAQVGSLIASAAVTVVTVPGITVRRFGINFEDLDAVANAGKIELDPMGAPVLDAQGNTKALVDFNDFAICFDGRARVAGQEIISLQDQKISFFTSHSSVCNHTGVVEIYVPAAGGGEQVLWTSQSFPTQAEPVFDDIDFPRFAKLRARITIVNQVDCTAGKPNNTVVMPSANTSQVEVLRDVCRFKDQPLMPPP